MKYFINAVITLCFIASGAIAGGSGGEFTLETVVDHFPVNDQGSTGTCWSFATTSFLESEIIRKGYPEIDLSEMFFVYHTYKNRAKRYILFHGNNNHTEGGQAHDVLDVLRTCGMVTHESFPGVVDGARHNHRKLSSEVQQEADRLNGKRDGFVAEEFRSFDQILQNHLGELPEKVLVDSKELTPFQLRDHFDINPDDYIELTSFSHHPFYKPFVLEIPDNWAHGLYYNLPIDELVEVMYHALENGYTVAWDGDTSEKTFSHGKGVADLPNKLNGTVDQDMRQETFYNRTTTDDHLMHVVGISKDKKGKRLFYTKNSWGDSSNKLGGYLHLTEDYVRLKTVAILVNKNSIPRYIKEKMML